MWYRRENSSRGSPDYLARHLEPGRFVIEETARFVRQVLAEKVSGWIGTPTSVMAGAWIVGMDAPLPPSPHARKARAKNSTLAGARRDTLGFEQFDITQHTGFTNIIWMSGNAEEFEQRTWVFLPVETIGAS